MASPELHVQVERLLEIERTVDARRLLAPAVAQAPDDAELQYLLARTALVEEDALEAERHLRLVLSGDPAHVGARRLLSQVAQGDHRYAEEQPARRGQRQHVGRRHFEQEAAQQTSYPKRSTEADRQAHGHRQQPLGEHGAEDTTGIGAERHPIPNSAVRCVTACETTP